MKSNKPIVLALMGFLLGCFVFAFVQGDYQYLKGLVLATVICSAIVSQSRPAEKRKNDEV